MSCGGGQGGLLMTSTDVGRPSLRVGSTVPWVWIMGFGNRKMKKNKEEDEEEGKKKEKEKEKES